MVGELEKHLAEELRRTGYPLEIEISSVLEGKGYEVSNNEYYLDSDLKKAREIDISADPRVFGGRQPETGPFTVDHHLVIECKKSDTHAWIFLTRPAKEPDISGQCMDFLTYATMDTEVSFLNTIRTICDKCLHYDSFGRIASAHAELKYQGKQAGKDEVLEAKNQLMKFVAYDIGKFLKEQVWLFNPLKTYFIQIYHPTIVFDGKMYEAVVKDGSIEMLEKKHLLLAATHSPPYLPDLEVSLSPHLDYLIDVVRKDYFGDFLQILENEYSAFIRCISENLERLCEIAKKNLRSFSVKTSRWKKAI